MIVDVGPLGCPQRGHGHADLLSIQCAIFGEPCLVDAGTVRLHAGTASGASTSAARRRTARCASTARIRRSPLDRFSWRRAAARDAARMAVDERARPGRCRAQRLRGAGRRRSRTAGASCSSSRTSGSWSTICSADGTALGMMVVSLCARCPVASCAAASARAETRNGAALWVVPFGDVQSRRRFTCGEIAPIRGWVSPNYGRRVPAPTLTYSVARALPMRAPHGARSRTPTRAPAQPSVGHPISMARSATGADLRRRRRATPVAVASIRSRARRSSETDSSCAASPASSSSTRATAWSAARLRRMRDMLAHRGPDGEGLVHRRPGRAGAPPPGHRRRGRRPAADVATKTAASGSSSTARSTTTPTLRPGLEARGHRYRTRSDTETILHLYEEEGERVVERLRGMFAFAIWDRPRAAPAAGARPARHQAALLRASPTASCCSRSEIKAILAAGPCAPAFNEAVLPEFLATRFVAGE